MSGHRRFSQLGVEIFEVAESRIAHGRKFASIRSLLVVSAPTKQIRSAKQAGCKLRGKPVLIDESSGGKGALREAATLEGIQRGIASSWRQSNMDNPFRDPIAARSTDLLEVIGSRSPKDTVHASLGRSTGKRAIDDNRLI